jgi:hypothetical protein
LLLISNKEKLVDEYKDVDDPVTEPLLNPQVVFCTADIDPHTPLDIGMLIKNSLFTGKVLSLTLI